MRKVLAVALSLALQAAALSAPLVHAHPDDHATDHHGGRQVHTHWSGHAHSHEPPAAPALDAVDHDRAVFLDTYVAVATSSFHTPAVAPPAFRLAVPGERAAPRTLDVTHGHDPPSLRSRSSRAPPAFLS